MLDSAACFTFAIDAIVCNAAFSGKVFFSMQILQLYIWSSRA